MSVFEAKDPNTLPARLAELSSSDDHEIVRALCRNPSVPLDVLLGLIQRAPADFLENPLLPVLLLEDPSFLQRAPVESRRAMIELPDAPGWVFFALRDDDDDEIKAGLASNPKAPEEILTRLARERDASLRCLIAAHPNVTPSLLESLSHDEESERVLTAISCNPKAPPALLHQFAEALAYGGDHNDARTLYAVVSNPSTTDETLFMLLEGSNRDVTATMAKREVLSRTVMERLSRVASDEGLRALASHPDVTEDELAFLVASHHWLAPIIGARADLTEVLRELIAVCSTSDPARAISASPGLSPRALSLMVMDGFGGCAAIAAHPNTPVAALESISIDDSSELLEALASNPKTPVHVLREVARYHFFFGVCNALDANPNTPADVKASLAPPEERHLLSDAAMHPSISAEQLHLIAEGDDPYTRGYVARHPRASPETLTRLTRYEDIHTRFLALAHRNAPLALLEEFASSPEEFERRGVASNPKAPVALLERLSRDESPWVRFDIARNPGTPVDLLRRLSQDEAEEVAREAAAGLGAHGVSDPEGGAGV